MVEPVIVQSIADPLIVAAEQKSATAQTTTSVAQTTTAAAQTQMAAAVTKMADIDRVPYPDYSVWLTAAAARSQHPNTTTASMPEVAAFADKVVAAFKQRFPRDVSVSPIPAPPANQTGFLPELNVSLFQPVTTAAPTPKA